MTKVLVVEDQAAVAESICLVLEAHGYEVYTESDGLNGLARAVQQTFDLLIVDIDLPLLDGLQLCTKLRAPDRPRPAPPIILLTGRAHAADRAAGLETGASAYLTKPFNGHELISHARALTQPPVAPL